MVGIHESRHAPAPNANSSSYAANAVTPPMFRYRLRTLLILMAVGPPLLAVVWWAIPNALTLFAVVWTLTFLTCLSVGWFRIRRDAEEVERLSLKNELALQQCRFLRDSHD
jgi:hypothetical protein